MTDILIAKINNNFETYIQNIRPFLSGVLNHIHGTGHLDKTTLAGLLEQASDHTIIFQQNFEVNYTLLEIFPSTLDNTLTNLSMGYELCLSFVGWTFAFSLDLDIDKDDYPVLRTLLPLRDSLEKLASCHDELQQFLVMIQPSTIGTMTIQTETEDQATQHNTPHTPSDTPRHPMAYPDTEHDPELDSEDQNIPEIESTDTLDNPIDYDPIGIKDNILPVVDNNTQDFNSPIDLNDQNNSMVIQAETNNSHKELLDLIAFMSAHSETCVCKFGPKTIALISCLCWSFMASRSSKSYSELTSESTSKSMLSDSKGLGSLSSSDLL